MLDRHLPCARTTSVATPTSTAVLAQRPRSAWVLKSKPALWTMRDTTLLHASGDMAVLCVVTNSVVHGDVGRSAIHLRIAQAEQRACGFVHAKTIGGDRASGMPAKFCSFGPTTWIVRCLPTLTTDDALSLAASEARRRPSTTDRKIALSRMDASARGALMPFHTSRSMGADATWCRTVGARRRTPWENAPSSVESRTDVPSMASHAEVTAADISRKRLWEMRPLLAA